MCKERLPKIYYKFFSEYGPQGWWPILNPETLIPEYNGGPRTDEERFEVMVGAVLTQNTGWYPNVVRALQQLKAGKVFTKEDLEVIEQAEYMKGIIREKPKKQRTDNILTQNTTWKNVEKAMLNLIKEKSINPKKIIALSEERLAELIRPAGYYNQKAKKLKILSEFVINNPIKDLKKLGVGELRKTLLSVHGVGPETADSIMLYALNKPIPIVDAYTKRIFSRIGFLYEKESYDAFQKFQKENFENDSYKLQELHALLVEHAKKYCKKNNPDCWMCPIYGLCERKF